MDNNDSNSKWRLFAEHLAAGVSATDAYLKAGYKPASRHSAEVCASRLRRRPEVAACIREARVAVNEEAREDAILTLRETLAYLAKIVRTSAATLGEDDELVEYARTFKDGSTALRIPNKLRALKLHAQLAGHFDRPSAPQPSLDSLRDILVRIGSPEPPTPPSPRPPIAKTSRKPKTPQHSSAKRNPGPIPPRRDRPPAEGRSEAPRTKAPQNANPAPALAGPVRSISTPNGRPRPSREPSPAQPLASKSAASPPPPGPGPIPIEDWPDDPLCQSLLRSTRSIIR